MATRVLMPKLSFIVTEGTILEWLKRPGDWVNKGESLLVIESEKATVEVEAPGTGVLGPDLAPVGTTVPVTTTIGFILDPDEPPPALERSFTELTPDETSPDPGAQGGEDEEAPEKPRIKASPSARRLAEEHGIDLTRVRGTGPQGRVIKKDIVAHLQGRTQPERDGPTRPTPAARRLATQLDVELDTIKGTGPGGRVVIEDVEQTPHPTTSPAAMASGPTLEPIELTAIQRITAERMAHSFQTAPHFYLSVQVDMSHAVALREAMLPTVETRTGVRLSFTDLLLGAVGRALSEHPSLNASLEQDRLLRSRDVNVALAVDTPRGLTVPVFHQIDRLPLAEIASRRAVLVDQARNNRLTPDDLSGGTFTVSNLGMFGIDHFSAIINPPQAAILAVGRIAKRPLVVDDALQLRPTMWLTLSIDHRVTDGASAARFLQDLVRHLENPSQMLVF